MKWVFQVLTATAPCCDQTVKCEPDVLFLALRKLAHAGSLQALQGHRCPGLVVGTGASCRGVLVCFLLCPRVASVQRGWLEPLPLASPPRWALLTRGPGL